MTVRVVIADHEPQRAEAIERLLLVEYEIQSLRCRSWASLLDELAQALIDGAQSRVVIFASNFPRTPYPFLGRKLDALFAMLSMSGYGHVVVLLEQGQQPVDVEPHTPTWLPVEPESADDSVLAALGDSSLAQKQLDSFLARLKEKLDPLLQLVPPPSVTWDTTNPILCQQLAWLNPKSWPDGERKVLQRLLAKFRPNCRDAKIHFLTPGYSGSLVFRVEWTDRAGKTDTGPVLMKISKHDDLWKIRRTFVKWEEINAAVNRSDLMLHAPKPLCPYPPTKDAPPTTDVDFLVESSGFYAEFWQFVSEVADWEKVHWHQDDGMPAAQEFVVMAIALLRDFWYKHATWSEQRPLWTRAGTGDSANTASPPYWLPTWWKAKILASLASLERLGIRLCNATWINDCMTIHTWLSEGPAESGVAALPERVLLSAIHGDLNKSNILWSLAGKRPLLIDFATYQSQAHTLLDFATLEVQVKYALMDREDGSKHLALDYADAQLSKWHERLAVLVPELPKELRVFEPLKSDEVELNGVVQAEALIGLIRSEAHEVFDSTVSRSGQTAPVGRFDAEYAAALLFLTLKAIGYDNSLSPFKRLLAVRSAASLIRRLNASGEAVNDSRPERCGD